MAAAPPTAPPTAAPEAVPVATEPTIAPAAVPAEADPATAAVDPTVVAAPNPVAPGIGLTSHGYPNLSDNLLSLERLQTAGLREPLLI